VKAELHPAYDTNRASLYDVIPLDSPFGVIIEPTRKCNLKCFFCLHHSRGIAGGALEQTGVPVKHIDNKLYQKIVADLLSFPRQPKRITFSGLGEPLMNPSLPEIIRYLRVQGYTGRIDIITNGVLLSPALSEKLIASGVSRIQISVQALTGERYRELTGVFVDMAKFIANVRYLYEHRGETQIYTKIIDSNLQNDSEKTQFFNTFGEISDTINIEHLILQQQQTKAFRRQDYDKLKTVNNEPMRIAKVCPMMFYFMQICVDGNVYPCCVPGLPRSLSMGNVSEDSLFDIWNSTKRNSMLRMNLRDGFAANTNCAGCDEVFNRTSIEEEYLDPYADELLRRLEKKYGH